MPQAQNELKCYGDGKVTDGGQVTVPSDARAEFGIGGNTRVMWFGDVTRGQLIVVPEPAETDKLLDFLSEHAARSAKS